MGVDTRRPPLPAPTDSVVDNNSVVAPTDLATNVSRMTDRTSYSLPEDGSPITIPTTKVEKAKVAGKSAASQTSLLIEYFEGGQPTDKSGSRPSVRVKVTPSSKKNNSVQITEFGQDRKASYSTRVPLGTDRQAAGGSQIYTSDGPNRSGRPIEVEVLGGSDVSQQAADQSRLVPVTSSVSSMPADSLLEGPVGFKSPEKASLEEGRVRDLEVPTMNTLKAPSREKSDRSKSRERIAQKVLEKLKEDPGENSGRRRTQRVRDGEGSREIVEEDYKGKSRRSSGSHRESATDSSLLRPRDGESNVSANSRSSLANNPRLLATVEDAIRRLILPEIETLKRQQSVRDSRYTRDSMVTDDDYSRTEHGRRLSKSSSAPQMNPKVVLNRGIDDPGVTLSGDTVKHRRHHRSSQDSSEKSSGRRESYDTYEKSRDRERRRRTKDKDETRSRDIEEEGLTADALRKHERRSRDREARERRKARGKSASQSDSIATTGEEYYDRSKIPPMPLNSDAHESDNTRDSIMSAEGAGTGRPVTSNTKSTEATTQPIKSTFLPQGAQASAQTSRGLESEPKSRSREASPYLKNQRSDRSIGSKGRSGGLAATGLGGAAGALYGIEKTRTGKVGRRSTSGSKLASEERGGSRSIADENLPKFPAYGDGHYGERAPTPHADLKTTAFDPSSTKEVKVQAPVVSDTTRNVRSQRDLVPDNKEVGHDRGISFDTLPDTDFDSSEDFYNEQHRLNNEYRKSAEYDSLRDSTITDEANRSPSLIQESPVMKTGAQEIKNIGANPTLVHTPDAPESAVASLVEDSQLSSSRSLQSGDQRFGAHSFTDSPNASGVVQQESPLRHMKGASLDSERSDNSRDRWAMLRESAQALSGSSKEQLDASPNRSVPVSVSSAASLRMGASGVPDMEHPMPEIGHGLEQGSPGPSEKSADDNRRSIVDGPLGDPYESREHWPFEPTPPPKSKRYGMLTGPTEDDEIMNHAEASLMGAAVGLGIDDKSRGVSGGTRSLEQDNAPKLAAYERGEYGERTPTSLGDLKSQSSASREELGHRDIVGASGRSRDVSNSQAFPTPQNMKDEGYISAAHADNITPLSFSKPPPRLFDDSRVEKYDPYAVGEDPFVPTKNARYLSGNSHGMSPQLYDAATGRGRNHIESKDVVALMDHLTVRDGQRNARDTEILVTLVRSAAEMRESFDEMKKTIEMQGKINMDHTEKAHDRSVGRILNAPRPQVLGSPRTPLQIPSNDGEFGVPKKQNIFKRALRGLSAKNTNDLSRMEEMLNRLLLEVEDIRMQKSTQSSSLAPREDITSYEQLRAAPDSGYEPEGNAGSSTPDHYIESPYSRRMHSGFIAPTDGKRISTVPEADEEAEELYANDDGMVTPTQEAQQQRELAFNTPTKPTDNQNFEASPETPWSSGKQPARYKHRSSGSSSWVPRISRWSKTTSSSGNRTSGSTMPVGERPYSEGSHSGSDVNVLPPEGVPYERADDDRIRSAGSLDRAIGGQGGQMPEASFEDPKYRANRHSLTLEHPQPRQGPTRRHQHHLESQAFTYGDARGPSPLSPNSDIFGSSAPLARWTSGGYPTNRLSASQAYDREATPYESEENYSGDEANLSTAQAATYLPPRPPKVREDAPAIPAKEPLDSYNYSREPTSRHQLDLDSLDSEEDDWANDSGIPLSRKQSPYSPGGLLAPIPERYSMEADRSSLGHRDSLRSRGGSIKKDPRGGSDNFIAEENEDGEEDMARALTPTLDPRLATSGPADQAGTAVRKLTGPREMPKSGNGIRRKPIGGEGVLEDAYKL